MSLYDKYATLLGIPYSEGNEDCYGLLRRYAKKNYDLELENYARPGDFAYSGQDLIMDYFKDEGFEVQQISLSQLQVGDVLLMRINGAPLVNHIAIYVGNNMIIHHLYAGLSREDNLSDRWKTRVMSVVRHPEITKKNEATLETFNMMDAIPKHVLPGQN